MTNKEAEDLAYERYKIYRGKAKSQIGYLNMGYQPPTPQSIINLQKQQLASFHHKLSKQELDMIKDIITTSQSYQDKFQTEITKNLDKIEKWAASLWKNQDYKQENIDKLSADNQLKLYETLLREWKNVLKLLKKGEVNAAAKAQIQKFETAVTDLENSLSTKDTVDRNIINRAQSAAIYAKGYYLEQAGKEFYEKCFPQFKIVATGQMKSVRDGGTGPVDLANDLVIVSKDANYNGLTLNDFLKKIDSYKEEKPIVLNNDEVNLLQQGVSIQAKASKDKTVRVHNKGFSVSGWQNLAQQVGTIHGIMLEALFSIAKKNSNNIYVSHPDYAAIGNYLFSKELAKHLHGNSLYLLRDGLYDTYSLFQKEFKQKNYVRILNNTLHLKTGSSSDIGLRII